MVAELTDPPPLPPLAAAPGLDLAAATTAATVFPTPDFPAGGSVGVFPSVDFPGGSVAVVFPSVAGRVAAEKAPPPPQLVEDGVELFVSALADGLVVDDVVRVLPDTF